MRGFIAQEFFERCSRRKCNAIFYDETAEAAAIAFIAQCPCEECEMDVAAGFLPCAERAGGHVLADAFFGAPKKCEFPIMNGARAIGREMCDPAALHERIDDAMRAVLYEVRAIHENDAGVTLSGGSDFCGAIANGGFDFSGAGWRSCRRVNEDFIDRAEASAFSQRINFQPLEIERFGHKAHVPDVLP